MKNNFKVGDKVLLKNKRGYGWNEEEIKIKEFDKQQLEILLNDLQDIDKFTRFKDGAFKYELGKYQANLLVGCIKKYKEVIDKAINNSQYWIDYYTRLNSDERIALRLQENIDILKEVE